MNKDIKYSGYTTIPSDYEVPDGQLAASLNLINENGALHPLSQPDTIIQLAERQTLLLLHKVTQQDNYIISAPLTGKRIGLYWLKKSDPQTAPAEAALIAEFTDILDIVVIGNTLCIAAVDEPISYILWSDNKYIALGSAPPRLDIEFAIVSRGTYPQSHKEDTSIDIQKATEFVTQPSWGYIVDEYNTGLLTDAAHALVNRSAQEFCYSRHYFWQPFFVRYAYRLLDGSNNWVSPPVLMLPSTLYPIASMVHGSGTLSLSFGFPQGSGLERDCSICGLAYRILNTQQNLDILSLWSDIIAGVDIFVSPHIPTYDTSSKVNSILPFRKAQEGAPGHLDIVSRSGGHAVYPGNYALAPTTYYDPRGNGYEHAADSFKEGITPDPFPENVNFRYHDLSIPSSGSSAISDDRGGGSNLYLKFSPNPDFRNQLLNIASFHHIHTYDVNDIKAMDNFDWVKVDCETSNDILYTRPTLNDAEYSNYAYLAKGLHAYNARLHAFGIEVSPPQPFPIRISQPYVETTYPDSDPSSSPTIPYNTRTVIYTSYNRVPIKTSTSRQLSDANGSMFPEYPPRYYFYPDRNASWALISSRTRWFLPLTEAQNLNGSQYLADFRPYPEFRGENSVPEGFPETSSTDKYQTSVTVDNMLRVSSANNPFVFPALSTTTIGSGDILGLSSAAKALSEGQFGQFPLYAFTNEGVWALEVSPSGSYIAKQPFTRDVCISPKAITQLDSAVLFPTTRGLILISGSNAQCISDPINSDYPFDCLSLTGFSKLHMMLNHSNTDISPDSCLPIQPFIRFLSNSDIIFDYSHQRIILYNPSFTYAYIFSLHSKAWGMTYSRTSYAVPSYPNALAVDNHGNLIDFAADPHTTAPIPALLVTRPLKLDMPDILKTIDNVIQRGHFKKGHVKSVLYGSRDLFNWHLVWSSKDHYMRGFRGTPYKYFRIALLCNLDPDESIHAASFQFTTRQTNQPR